MAFRYQESDKPVEETKIDLEYALKCNKAHFEKGGDQTPDYGDQTAKIEHVIEIKDELKKLIWYSRWRNSICGNIKISDELHSLMIDDGNEGSHCYLIWKLLDGSHDFNDDTGKSIYRLIPDNSTFHSRLKLYDGSGSFLSELKHKIFTLRNTWKATGPSGNRFNIHNSHRLRNDYSDLNVKLNKESEKNGFDYKIRRNKTDKSFFVYKGSSAKVVSKVVVDASNRNKYLVEVDPKEDCDILKKIVFSVTAVADAGESNGKKNENAFKFGGGVELYSYFGKNKKNVSAVDKHTCVSSSIKQALL